MKRKQFGRTLVLALLLAALSTSALAAYTTLRYGHSGSNVKKLQQALTLKGYSKGAINSKYDSATESAVKAFEDEFLDRVSQKTYEDMLYAKERILARISGER